MKITPTSISRKIVSIKSDIKEYYRKDNVFPDSKVENNMKLAGAAALALGCAALFGARAYYSKMKDYPKINFDKFFKKGYFEKGAAIYDDKPFSGQLLKYTKDGFLKCIAYNRGRLTSVHTFNTRMPSPTYEKKIYVYDPKGLLSRIHTRKQGEIRTILRKEDGRIVLKNDGKISKIIQPFENNQIRITDYLSGKPIVKFYTKATTKR